MGRKRTGEGRGILFHVMGVIRNQLVSRKAVALFNSACSFRVSAEFLRLHPQNLTFQPLFRFPCVFGIDPKFFTSMKKSDAKRFHPFLIMDTVHILPPEWILCEMACVEVKWMYIYCIVKKNLYRILGKMSFFFRNSRLIEKRRRARRIFSRHALKPAEM